MDIQLDPAKLDAAERSIDEFIEKRARQVSEQPLEDLWAASDRANSEKRRQELTAAWAAYHRKMHQLHAALSEEHRTKSEALCDVRRD